MTDRRHPARAARIAVAGLSTATTLAVTGALALAAPPQGPTADAAPSPAASAATSLPARKVVVVVRRRYLQAPPPQVVTTSLGAVPRPVAAAPAAQPRPRTRTRGS